MGITKINGRVCVVEFNTYLDAFGSGHADLYESRLAMVLAQLRLGSIGDGVYGSEAHMKALVDVESGVQRVREAIAIEQKKANTCNRHADCAKADEISRAKGFGNADHCDDPECEDCFGR